MMTLLIKMSMLVMLLCTVLFAASGANALELYVKMVDTEGECTKESPCSIEKAIAQINQDPSEERSILNLMGDGISVNETQVLHKSMLFRSENENEMTKLIPCIGGKTKGALFNVGKTNINITMEALVYTKAPQACYAVENTNKYSQLTLNFDRILVESGAALTTPFMRIGELNIHQSKFNNLTETIQIGSEYSVIDDIRNVVIQNSEFSGGDGILFSNFQHVTISGCTFSNMKSTSIIVEGVCAEITQNTFTNTKGFKGGAIYFLQTPVFPNVILDVNKNIFVNTQAIYGGAIYIRLTAIFPSWYFKMHNNEISESKATYGGALYFASGIPNLNDPALYNENTMDNVVPSNFGSSINNITIQGKNEFYKYPGEDIQMEGSLRDYFGNVIYPNHEAFNKVFIEPANSTEPVWVHSNPLIVSKHDSFEVLDLELYGKIGSNVDLVIRSNWVAFVDNQYIKSINAPFSVNFQRCPTYSNTKNVPAHEELQLCELDPIPQSIYLVGMLFGIGAIGVIFISLVFSGIRLTAFLRNRKFNSIYTNL